MEVFRTPDDRFRDLPGYDFEPRYTEIDGMRMHFVDEGAGDPIVLFHGEPTWAYLYRKMIWPLSEKNRVVVPDYIGFGRSDKLTDRNAYTYDRHVAWVTELLSGLDLERATLVVHDWGGPIGLRWAVENAERVSRLVILNTGIFKSGMKASKGFMAWRNFAERNPDLPVGFVIQSATVSELPDEIMAGYEAPFPTPESKAGAAQFPLIVPLEDSSAGAAEMQVVQSELEKWEKPTLALFSDSDPVFSTGAGKRLAEAIPGAEEMRVIEGAAHFLQEDRGEEIATEILSFLERSG